MRARSYQTPVKRWMIWSETFRAHLWRRRWTAAVVLFRTVLWVLETVDIMGDRKLRRIILEMRDERKAAKPEPLIFWDFIHEDRNLIAHQYKHPRASM